VAADYPDAYAEIVISHQEVGSEDKLGDK